MRILHLTHNFYPVVGGVETFVLETSKRLTKMGHNVIVITSNKTPNEKKMLINHEVVDGIEVFRVPFNRIFRYNISFEVLKKILNLKYDIIHVHGFGFLSDLIPSVKLFMGKKIFISTHGGIFHTRYASFFKNLYFDTILRFDLLFADKIIAHSLKDKKLFLKISNPNRISLVNYGINWERLSKIKRKNDGKTLIYVGRLAKNKRLDRILHVLYHLKKKIPDIKLLLIGSDWGEKEKLIRLAKELDVLGNMEFVGSVPHEKVEKCLSKSDIFLLSSSYEGFGISVLEAMASGLPVVVNNIPSMKEIISNGKNGFVVDFSKYKKVSKLIIKILKDKKLQKSIDRNAKASTKKYDWENICDKLIGVYVK